MVMSMVLWLLLIISLTGAAVKFGYSQCAICRETKAKVAEFVEENDEIRAGYVAVLKREYLYTGCLLSGIVGVTLFVICQLLKTML